ncbi:MAG: S41 family peptidase [bacterium]|nr:S41 family peptidase [bacterium]
MESSRTLSGRTRSLTISLLIAVVFIGGFFAGVQFSVSRAQGITLPEEAQAAFEPLYQSYNLIQSQYIEDIDDATLVNGAINGMVEALEDQYSSYADPETFAITSNDLSGEIEGIGVVISLIEDTEEVEIVNVLPGTPAEEAGLQEGDIFVAVNGEEVAELNTLELAILVRGPVGTTVDITVRRGEELVDFTIERARIQIVEVTSELLDGSIGYVSLANFSVNARQQMFDAIQQLKADGMTGLIIDLRGNPGGLLTAATEVTGLLLEDGVILNEEFGSGETRIFKIENGVVNQIFDDGRVELYSENAGYADPGVPVVVLVDERSASASELVAGAWQDQGVATIMGVTTFGKGTVQVQNTLVNGGGLRLTIARWLTPNGDWITDIGVTPDIVVEMPEVAEGETLPDDVDPQLDAALEFLQEGVAEGQ